MNGDQTPGRIVVGVDGSLSSRAALAWAVRQAGLAGASVEAVTAWHYPVMAGGVPIGLTGELDNSDYREWAASALDQTIKQAVGPDGPVRVSATVREGNAAQVLAEVADGADLLVVGSRGHGGFTEALLGSVSQACVHHAECPVVIVREPKAS
jgi:nucleotide-binding universal stress UspA family protein